MFYYEIVLSTENGDKVVSGFYNEYDDLTTYDDRTPVSCGSNEYIRLED